MECGCCFGETRLSMLVQCSEGHVFCVDCLKRYARECVFANGTSRLKCMASDEACAGTFLMETLRSVLSRGELKQLEERAAFEAARMARVPLTECPACGEVVERNGHSRLFECPRCKKSSCIECRKTYHAGECKTDARLREEEEKTKRVVRTCPSCRAQFVKVDGCNKMRCACGGICCYVCHASIQGYDHFCQVPFCTHQSCGKCALFDDNECRISGANGRLGKKRRREVSNLLVTSAGRRQVRQNQHQAFVTALRHSRETSHI